MRGNRCSNYEGLLLCSISLSTTGCQTGSLDKEKQSAVIHFYSETGIQKTYSTKPSPTTLKHCISLLLLCVSLRTLCVSPLRHFAASRTLCVTPAAFCVDDVGPLAFAFSLLGSAWPALAVASRSLHLRWSLSTISASPSSTHCPSLLIIDLTLLSNPALANQMIDHSGVSSN